MNTDKPLARILHRFLRSTRGALSVEFALIVPFLMLLSLGTVDFARAAWASSTLKEVASDAGRFASIRGAEKEFPATETDIVNYAKSKATGLSPDDLIVDVSWAPNNTSGSRVTVTVSYDIDFISIGFLPLNPIRLEHSSTLTIG